MDRTMKQLQGYVQDLRSVLELECSCENAKELGTLKEWNSIDRKIRKLERRVRGFQDRFDIESRDRKDVCDKIKYALVLCLPFLIVLLKAIINIGLVAFAVYLVLSWMNKPFSVTTVLVVWIIIEVVAFFVQRRTKH